VILEHRDYRIVVGVVSYTGRVRWAIAPASEEITIRDACDPDGRVIENGYEDTAGAAIRAAKAAIDNIHDGPPRGALARLLDRITRRCR